MSRQVLLQYIDRLSDDHVAVLAGNLDQFETLVACLFAAAGLSFTHRLDYTAAGLIKRLVRAGEYTNYVDPAVITDEKFLVSGEGVVEVRYRILSGEELKRDWNVFRSDVETRFRAERMRFSDPAEALLPMAENYNLGRGEHPLVIFLRGSEGAFVVRKFLGGRQLHIYFGHEHWDPNFVFLGVCE